MTALLPIPTEHVEQVRLFAWATYAQGKYPALSLLYAIPNGGARHPVVAAKLKAEGVKRGVPDVCLPVPRGSYHGLYIELKRQRGTRPSGDQIMWIASLSHAGYRAIWCRGWETARDEILAYLALPRCAQEQAA